MRRFHLLKSTLIILAVLSFGAASAVARDFDNNPPGPLGGPGTNWENPPGPVGGWGTSPNQHDRDNNPPGIIGGPGTNWENPPGPVGGVGASPNRHHPALRYCRHHLWC